MRDSFVKGRVCSKLPNAECCAGSIEVSRCDVMSFILSWEREETNSKINSALAF